MSLQPSASKSYIFVNCSYAFDPAHEELSGSIGSAASRYGSAFHAVTANCIDAALVSGKKPKEYDAWIDTACETWHIPPAARLELAGHVWGAFQYLRNWMRGDNPWSVDWTDPKKMDLIVEKSYAVDVAGSDGVRAIEGPSIEEHRYPDVRPTEIPLTLDVMVLSKNHDVPALVLDHKTGSSKDFSAPETDEQMLTMGLVPDVGVGDFSDVVLAVNHADRRGLPMVYARDVSQEMLNVHEARLAKAFERIGDGSMRPGPWCEYCPGKSICPTQYAKIAPSAMAIVESIGLSIQRPEKNFEITPQFMGRMHQMRSQINAVLKKVDAEIHAYVEDNPTEIISRPDGKTLEWVTREYENISKKAFIDTLGPVEAEKWFMKLRKLGVLVKGARRELHAVKEQGE